MYNIKMISQEEEKYSYEKRMLEHFLRVSPIVTWDKMIKDSNRIIDFRFDLGNGILGIELTRCIGEAGTKAAEKERLLNSIVEKAQQLYQNQSSLNLLVSVHLWHTESINKHEAKRLTNGIVHLLNVHFKSISNIGITPARKFLLYLDRNIKGRVYVQNLGSLPNHRWRRINPCWVRQHPYTLLQETIAKKTLKIKRYKSCANKIYLLITANRALQSESMVFDERLLQQRFYSKFDKTFFFDVMTRQFFELQTVPFKYQSNVWKDLKREQRQKKQLKNFT